MNHDYEETLARAIRRYGADSPEVRRIRENARPCPNPDCERPTGSLTSEPGTSDRGGGSVLQRST